MESEAPARPRGLGASGRRLWDAITGAYELRIDEWATLEHACRGTDDVSRLTAALKAAPTQVVGSTGQIRPNPLFAEVRHARLAVAKLLAQLGLPDSDGIAADRAKGREWHARRAARERWG